MAHFSVEKPAQFRVETNKSVLAEPGWLERMTADDHRGLTPAIHGHINPYGCLDADLSRRIDFEQHLAA